MRPYSPGPAEQSPLKIIKQGIQLYFPSALVCHSNCVLSAKMKTYLFSVHLLYNTFQTDCFTPSQSQKAHLKPTDNYRDLPEETEVTPFALHYFAMACLKQNFDSQIIVSTNILSGLTTEIQTSKDTSIAWRLFCLCRSLQPENTIQ